VLPGPYLPIFILEKDPSHISDWGVGLVARQRKATSTRLRCTFGGSCLFSCFALLGFGGFDFVCFIRFCHNTDIVAWFESESRFILRKFTALISSMTYTIY